MQMMNNIYLKCLETLILSQLECFHNVSMTLSRVFNEETGIVIVFQVDSDEVSLLALSSSWNLDRHTQDWDLSQDGIGILWAVRMGGTSLTWAIVLES